jgi:orotate phosphoribosyltransferase
MKIIVPTFKWNNLPQALKSTPISVPGSRFIKWKDLGLT